MSGVMVEFTLYNEDAPRPQSVLVDADAVISVHEDDRRPLYGFNQPVAVIQTTHGKLIVYDHNRTAAKRIADGRSNPSLQTKERLT